MKFTKRAYKRIIPKTLAMVAMLMYTSACSDSVQDSPAGGGKDELSHAEAGFYITVGDAVQSGRDASRAPSDPAGGYDPGEGYENYIDVKGGDFRIYFFNSDDKYLAAFSPTSVVPVSGTDISKRYYVKGKIDAREIAGVAFKVMILANWGEYPEPVKGQSLESIVSASSATNIYSYTQAASMPSENNPIPLYGIKLFTDVTFTPDVMTEVGTIHLLRAYAKVTISCATPGWNMCNVTLTRYNTTGLKAPVGVNTESAYVKNDYDTDYVDHISLPDGVGAAENLRFNESRSNPGEYILYIPEYRNVAMQHNTTPLSTCARIRVNFDGVMDFNDDTRLRDFYVDFKQYGGDHKGHYFDIQRNYWYAFEVTKASEDYEMEVEVDVIPFSEVPLNPDFGLERDDISGYVVVRDPVTKKILYWRDAAGNKWYIYQDGETHFVFAYDDKTFENLDHWFDFTGVKHALTPAGVSGYKEVYDATFQDQLLYWESEDGHKYWLVQTELFSAIVYDYSETGANPSGNPLYWFDFMGNRHEMSEDEQEVLKDWIPILTGKLP